MNIVKTKDPVVIKFIGDRIIKFIDDNEVIDYTADSFIRWLRVSLSSPFVVAIVAKNDDDAIIGHCIATIIQTFNNERLEILQFSGDTDDAEKELFSYVHNWSKELFIKKISIMTKYPKKWKEFGFELNSHVFTMGVS